MEFNDGKLEYSERPLDENELEFLNESKIRIDNGRDRIIVDLDEIRHNIEHLMNEDNILKVINRIQDFAENVRSEKDKGVHLGSSDLASAVASEMLMINHGDVGLRVAGELKTLSEIIKKSCKNDNIPDFKD